MKRIKLIYFLLILIIYLIKKFLSNLRLIIIKKLKNNFKHENLYINCIFFHNNINIYYNCNNIR
jgi:hypothetical protein